MESSGGPAEAGYERFAAHAFYLQVNERLVELSGARAGQVILDVASGTGAMTLLLARPLAGDPRSRLLALDSSGVALAAARANADCRKVGFLQGTAGQIPLRAGTVDVLVCANAIHNMEDKPGIFREFWRCLKPSGTVALNTTFYAGGEPPESSRFYRAVIARAARILRNADERLTRGSRVEARRRLSPADYATLLADAGFVVETVDVAVAEMPEESYVDICEFPDFMQGVFPGVPTAASTPALQQAFRQTFAELGIETVPRNWLTLVGRRAA